MSKAVKRVLSVAAVIAIPFVAPVIAASAFMAPIAGAIGSTATAALSGAALGAAKGAVFGEDIGRQALFGAIGGGLGQYNAARAAAAEQAAAAAATPTGPMTAAANTSSLPAGLNTTGAATVPTGPMTAATGANSLSQTVQAGTQAGQAGTSFVEALKKVPAEVAARFQDPKQLADLTLRAAGMLAGSVAAGEGLTDQEMALLNAQMQDLDTMRRMNNEVFMARLNEAQQLIGESRYFDPDYFGRMGAAQAQFAGSQAKRAGLRGKTGEERRVASRQYDLGISRNAAAGYDSGYQTGVEGRLKTRAAGLAAFPGMYPSQASYAGIGNMYDLGERRAAERARNIGEFFGSLTGRRDAERTGNEEDEEERQRLGG